MIFVFFGLYIKKTGLRVKLFFSRRLTWGILLGVLFGLMSARNVISRPETEKLTGILLYWAVFWRGFFYGAVDGLLLFSFPWIVTWRSLRAEGKNTYMKIGSSLIAWVFILLITTFYHLGYTDFRSKKIIQPNIGSTIASIPTLITANPIASPITHIFLHVTAVVHSPYTKLFLPPHREKIEE
jgi:hypothetical protein